MPDKATEDIVRSMTGLPADRPLRVELNLVPGTGPVAGQVLDGTGGEWAFTGWLELIQLVDQLRSASSAPGEAS